MPVASNWRLRVGDSQYLYRLEGRLAEWIRAAGGDQLRRFAADCVGEMIARVRQSEDEDAVEVARQIRALFSAGAAQHSDAVAVNVADYGLARLEYAASELATRHRIRAEDRPVFYRMIDRWYAVRAARAALWSDAREAAAAAAVYAVNILGSEARIFALTSRCT